MREIMMPNSLGDSDGVIWYNGALVDWRQAHLHCLSHSLHYASAVFDGIRVYGGRLFRPEAHMTRLLEGAQALHMNVSYTPVELVEAAQAVVSAQGVGNGYVRPLVWRGPGQMDFNPKPNPPNIAIAAWALDVFLKNGSRLVLGDYRRPAPEAGPWRTKATGNYLPATLSKARALEEGYDDALMLSARGHIADTTGTNIFLVSKGRLYTPRPEGFFAGLTRQAVMEIGRQEQIETIEDHITPDFLSEVDEVFLTGTAAGIVPVSEIDLRHSVHFFKHGPVTRKITEKYRLLYQAVPQAIAM